MKHAVLGSIAAIALSLTGLPTFAQTLTWSSPTAELAYVGGSNQRPGVTTVVFNNALWVAYTKNSGCTGSDCPILISTNGGGSGQTWGAENTINSSYFSEGYAVSNNNPALAVVDVSGTQTLFLAFGDSYGEEYLMSSTTGTSWTNLYVISGAYGAVTYPTLAVNPSDSTLLYMGYMSGSTFTPILCTVSTSNPNTQSCQNLTGLNTMNFAPAMAFWNGLLYLGFADRGNSHCLYFYKDNTSTNTFTFWNPLSCGEQTSTGPSLATHDGYLYVAFGTNDSSRKFTVRVSTTGSDLGYRQQPGYSMSGPPALLDLSPLGVAALTNGFAESSDFWNSTGTP